MAEKSIGNKSTLKKHEVAKPLHVQRLEAAMEIRPFVDQVEKLMNSDGSDNDDDDIDITSLGKSQCKDDKKGRKSASTKKG